MGHQSCGALSEATNRATEHRCGCRGSTLETAPNLEDFLGPVIRIAYGALDSEGSPAGPPQCDERGKAIVSPGVLDHVIEYSALNTRDKLMEGSPAIRDAVQAGKLHIVVCVYRMDTGKLEILDDGGLQ